MITITIETDNAAFDESPEVEVARILRKLADRVTTSGLDGDVILPLKDLNGNSVGELVYYDE